MDKNVNACNVLKNGFIRIGISVLLVLVIFGVRMLIEEFNMRPKIKELQGTWQIVRTSGVEWSEIMELLDFYEEEIQLYEKYDPDKSEENSYVQYGEDYIFTSDKKYSFVFDKAKTKEVTEEKLIYVFQVLFDHRDEVDDLYELDFTTMTQEEFNLFYAVEFSFDTFSELVSEASEYVSSLLEESYTGAENGKYSIVENYIVFDSSIDSNDGKAPYKIINKRGLHIEFQGPFPYEKETFKFVKIFDD